MLNGQRIAYNSDTVVNIRDIGTGGRALLCVTDRSSCCSGAGRAGEWYYPDGRRVNIQGAREDFYRNRGVKIVRLNRARNIIAPTGRYRCEVPDASGIIQSIFINITGNECLCIQLSLSLSLSHPPSLKSIFISLHQQFGVQLKLVK